MIKLKIHIMVVKATPTVVTVVINHKIVEIRKEIIIVNNEILRIRDCHSLVKINIRLLLY